MPSALAEHSPDERSLTPGSVLTAAAIYLAIVVLLTWPLSLHLRDATPSDWIDSKQTVWIFAWEARALRSDPTSVFQAPIFHPEPDALAYSDHVLGLGVLAAPIIWSTGNPFLAHNIIYLLGQTFSALAAFLLVADVTGNRRAGFVAGAAFAFSPYWFGHIIPVAHIQTVVSGWIPLALFALHRWLKGWSLKSLVLLGSSVVFATLTSWYHGAFLVLALPVFAGAILWTERHLPPRAAILQLGGLIVLTAGILAPFVFPYARAHGKTPGTKPSREIVADYSASWRSYVTPPRSNILYGSLVRDPDPRQDASETHLFPGVGILGLAAVGVAAARGATRFRASRNAGIALVLCGVIASLGVRANGADRFLLWAWLSKLPLFGGLRTPARAYIIALVGLAVLAGIGTTTILQRAKGGVSFVAFSLTVFLAAEGLAIPLDLGHPRSPLPQYAALARRPGAILELPTVYRDESGEHRRFGDIDYMLNQLDHWRPLANGWGTVDPPAYSTLIQALASFPDERSIRLLRERGIRTLVVHRDAVSGTPWADVEPRLAATPGFALVARNDELSIYDVSQR